MTAKFAMLSYKTNNLGDEIQSIAVRQFLPRVDVLIDRDDWDPSSPIESGPYKLILNGWFTHSAANWPPPSYLSALVTSMHISQERHRPETLVPASLALMRGENLAYLKRHGPVGARDQWTASLLREHGVESYFSGCVTLTLGERGGLTRGDYICAVDLDADLGEALKAQARGPIVALTHRDTTGGSFERRCASAGRLLSLYAHARCVVTTRLHCALPCLAFGTPVLLIDIAPDQYRFSGLHDLMRHCDPGTFKAGATGFRFDDPEPNGASHLPLKDHMIARLQAFTGASMTAFQPASLAEILPVVPNASYAR